MQRWNERGFNPSHTCSSSKQAGCLKRSSICSIDHHCFSVSAKGQVDITALWLSGSPAGVLRPLESRKYHKDHYV